MGGDDNQGRLCQNILAELTNDVEEDWIREYRTIRLDIIYTTAAFHRVTFFFTLRGDSQK